MNKQASSFNVDMIFSYYQKYNNQIFIGMLVVAGLITAAFYYRGYNYAQEQSAQAAFSICMQELDRALQGQTSWPEVELASRAGYQQHRNTAIAPYFLAVQAQSLENQSKKVESVAVLDELLRTISTKSPVYYLYATKRGLIKLDIPEVQSVGLQELEDLSHNAANPQRDEALYYLMNYYDANNNQSRAQALREELETSFKQSGPAASPFAERAASHLASLER